MNIQNVKKEAREMFFKETGSLKDYSDIDAILDKIVELSAKAHEEATRIDENCEHNVCNLMMMINERKVKSKQFFEEKI